MNIKIYGKPNCSYCESAKNLLTIKNIPFTYMNLMDMTPTLRHEVIYNSGMTSVPMIDIDGKFIGGFNQLETYLKERGL